MSVDHLNEYIKTFVPHVHKSRATFNNIHMDSPIYLRDILSRK